MSLLDWLLLGRQFPSRRSLLALLGVACGAAGYVLFGTRERALSVLQARRRVDDDVRQIGAATTCGDAAELPNEQDPE